VIYFIFALIVGAVLVGLFGHTVLAY